MSGQRKPEERLFAGLREPAPPSGLREQVLNEALEALRKDPEPRNAWTRLWENRTVRLAYGACVVVLTATHLAITPGPVAPEQRMAGITGTTSDLNGELAEIASLPALRLDVTSLGDLLARQPRESGDRVPAAPGEAGHVEDQS